MHKWDALKKIARKHKILLSIAAVGLIIILKFSFYNGLVTCKPMKYRGTIVGVLLGYDKNEKISLKDHLDQIIPKGMPAKELMSMLNEQGLDLHIGHVYYDYPDGPRSFVEDFRAGYYKTDIPAPDYVVSWGAKYTCIHGEYLPGFAIWIKDEKVFKTRFYVDRSFI